MFTDGLDHNALQWIKKEEHASRNLSPSVSLGHDVASSPERGGGRTNSNWGLPPSQLANVHLHSGLLRPGQPPNHPAGEDLEESVGSISGGVYDDLYDTDGSGDSSVLWSPRGNNGHLSSDHERKFESNPPDPLPSPMKGGGGVRQDTEYGTGFYSHYEQHAHEIKMSSLGFAEPQQTESADPEPRHQRREGFTGSDSFTHSVPRRPSPSVRVNDEKLVSHNADHSSDTDSSEDDDNVADGKPTRIKRNSYPEIDDFRSSQDSMEYRGVFAATGVQPEGRIFGRRENDGSSQARSRLWISEPNLKFQSLRPCEDLLCRGCSDCVPPSAPPMLASMILEPASEVATQVPVASNPTSFSHQNETRKTSGSSQPAEQSFRSNPGAGAAEESNPSIKPPNVSFSHPPPPPVYGSGQAAWQALIAYDACVRLCLNAWARGCPEAPEFLQDECTLLRHSFGLQHLLLQPFDEMKRTGVRDEAEATATSKVKRNVGKLKIQVRKIRVIQRNTLRGSASQRNLTYVGAGAQYMRQVSGLLKDKVNILRSNALDGSPEGLSCLLKLKSSTEDEAVRIQPGSGDTTAFLLESTADELMIDVQDANRASQGHCVIPLALIVDDPVERIRWFSLYAELERECIGKVQLSLGYTLTSGELVASKWGAVGETLAYDIVLQVAMRAQSFQRRNLRLQGSWSWLLSNFASYYGVSEIYTKLRYLASVMEVATPTEDCLLLIYDLLSPIIKTRNEGTLDRQEKRIFTDVNDQVSQLLTLVFENYKSLDETSPSGMSEMFPAVGAAAPALVPAVQIYTLLHDILLLDTQICLRNYFQTAARKRCKRHMADTDEFVSSTNEGFLMDPLTMATAYQKMKVLCMNIGSEVRTDIDIHNQHVLPSSIDLPNVVANVYNGELRNRLRSFLVACPPSSPSPPVAELMMATSDFQQDLISWGIKPGRGGVDARELFHLYIELWIQDKRLHLLDFCKLDKDRYMWLTTENVTVPFVEDMYGRVEDTLNEYEVIINRWPEYTIPLEVALADVERAILAAIEKQFADVLSPLKDVMIPKKFSIQYMQKLTRRRSICLYSVPSQLGVMLNSIKRLLDTLRPKVEMRMKGWVACLPSEGGALGKAAFGERLNEVRIEVRAKYRNYLHAVVEKLADNARLQSSTKLKKILQDTREAGGESDIRERMQPLNNQIVETISHLHEVFASRVFVAVCRGYWDRMARDVLHFLENRKENRSWYKGSSVALGILDDIFASQMQRLQGHALQEKDLDPPRSVMEARSMLSKDAQNGIDSSSLFFY